MWLGKRLFDFVFSSLGLIILSPFFLFVGALIKLTSPGPIFYRQVRVGLNGKEFRIHKFRSMYLDADRRGLALTVGRDPRITPVGHYIRKYKLDEFAQLIDVFRGAMSLVGPRPEVPKYVAHYPSDVRKIVLSVRPGITDRASVFFKDENELLAKVENPEEIYIQQILPVKLKYCVEYVQKASFAEDVKLILLTLGSVFFRV